MNELIPVSVQTNEDRMRGYILRYAILEQPDEDDGDEAWTVTPFDKDGAPCGEPLVLLERNLRHPRRGGRTPRSGLRS